MTADAYAVQHPGTESSQSIQSVAIHLMSLYFIIEEEMSHDKATQMIKNATKLDFHWLKPPTDLGVVNANAVWVCKSAEEHHKHVQLWAHSVWKAWREHHDTIRKWAQLVENY